MRSYIQKLGLSWQKLNSVAWEGALGIEEAKYGSSGLQFPAFKY
jgi:hypothetical protein